MLSGRRPHLDTLLGRNVLQERINPHYNMDPAMPDALSTCGFMLVHTAEMS